MSVFFFFSSRRRHTRFDCDWSSDVCSSDLIIRHQSLDRGIAPRVAPARFENGGNVFHHEPDPELSRPFPCQGQDRKSTRLNSSHSQISYAVFCLKKKKTDHLPVSDSSAI